MPFGTAIRRGPRPEDYARAAVPGPFALFGPERPSVYAFPLSRQLRLFIRKSFFCFPFENDGLPTLPHP